MASVNLGAPANSGPNVGLDRWQTLLGVGILTSSSPRIRPVGRVGDRHDPVLHQDVSGDCGSLLRGSMATSGLVDKLSTIRGRNGLELSAMLPDFTNNWDLALVVHHLIAVQWWAVRHPCRDGTRRRELHGPTMLASRTERDALAGTLFFKCCHYALVRGRGLSGWHR